MSVSAEMVKNLREKTGAGMMECKKALAETNGDFEKAIEALRKRGLAAAAKKSGRIAAEGLVGTYIHAGGSIGVMVELNCETDFVAKTDDFRGLLHDICLHIAAHNPTYLSPEEVPAAIVEKEKQIAMDQCKQEGKPQQVWEKIAEGKVKKYYDETCLLEQSFVKDPNKKVKDILQEAVARIGENLRVRRFTRFEMGEGIEKKQGDFAAEVAATVAQG